MYELVRLKVSGFRGFVREKEFVFDQPVVLLFGENHRGKSSTLNAVEWCLFGDECVGKKTGIRERVGWEIANRTQGDVIVTTEFAGPKGIYKIVREQSVARKRGAQKVSALLPDGSQVQGDDAEYLLRALFRSSFQDFMTTVYQHQEAIRAILTQEPRDRNDAIDRLLGLSPYREILKGIVATNLEQAVNGMDGKREDFRGRCEQAIRTLDNLLSEERAKALTDGITHEEMTEQGALHRAGEIAKAVESLAKELGVVGFKMKIPADFKEIADFREWVKTQTDLLWAQAPDVQKQQALATERAKLVTVKANYEAIIADETLERNNKVDFVKQFGDEATLDRAAKETKQGTDQLEHRIGQTNARANLVREATEYLGEFAPEATKGQCPLCGADAPELLSHLQAEWEEKIKAEVEGLERQREESRTKLGNIQSLVTQLRTLNTKLEKAGSRRQKGAGEVAAALGRKVGQEDDPLALLSKQLRQIDLELQATNHAIGKKRNNISAIYEKSGKLRAIHEILSHELKKNGIESIWNTREFTELEKALNEACQLAEDIKAIKSALAEAAREEAKAKIHAAEAALDKYFCCIAKHPAIPGLVMEVTEDRRTGLNSYNFKSKDGTDPTPILSQGDLNCLAISLFLGLSEATGETQRFGFLMLDDPTQSLGSEMKGELVKVLEDIASRRKLIIATPDAEFKNLLTVGITRSKATYKFADWNEKTGPQVTGAT
ncbi:MAG: AAA family ATPase [Chloroflexi bacterium]|nr:AAA family ATPase [Chloroflexota bacterium]